VERTPLPALVDAKRRLCGELLAAAAVHSAITDDLEALEACEATRPLTAEELERRIILRGRKRAALLRHDAIDHRLRRLSAHLRLTALDARRPARP
jgi:hypothetical protein